jgi:DNA repair protein RadC
MAFEVLYPYVSDLQHEEFWVVFVDRGNRILGVENVSKGGVDGTLADARLVFRPALQHLASGVILCHNHPSGNVNPSQDDIDLTRKLRIAGKSLEIPVLDHIIIGNADFYSFADNGMLI